MILRHAKAEAPNRAADLERSLTERGHADAGAAGAWLVSRGYLPNLVICSPARRTRQTWHGVAVALAGEGSPEVRYQAEAYGGGTTELLGLLRTTPAEVGTVLLIGHNPTMSMLSMTLDPAAPSDSDGLRTSGLAVHTMETAWDALVPGGASLIATHTARA
ncbi:histidine phosphatase family protein [Rugosimonospora acidiphila]|uniref:Histidine phosphatase family protein n=1 Tax=Rugosimonospora acidiphila TaxID=556531 RepID=A0ABP9RH36_9ACTN